MLSNFSVLKNNALFPEGMKGRAANRVNNEQLKIYVPIIIQPLALRLCRHTAPGRTRLHGFRGSWLNSPEKNKRVDGTPERKQITFKKQSTARTAAAGITE